MFETGFLQLIEWFQSDALRITLIVVLIIVLSNLEMIVPAESGQTLSGRIRNMGYITLFFVLGSVCLHAVSVFITIHPRIISVSGWSIVLFLLVGMFLSDLLFYWYHRAQHTFAWLWPIHELHHSDTELNVTTSMRSYWVEYPIQALIISLPVQLIIGINGQVQLLAIVAMTSWLFFAHMNVRLRLGVLTPLICGPQVHRIHHSVEPEHQQKNFAQFFPCIDILFGTYYAPGRDEFPQTGTPGLASDASFFTTLVRPVKIWLRR